MILPTIFMVCALAALAWGIRLREGPYRSARRHPVAARCTPPPGVDLVLAADALGVPARALSAELIDLAVAGHLRIVDIERRADDGRGRHVPGVRLLRADLSSPYASRASLLRALFGDAAAVGDVLALSPHDTALSARLDARRAELAGRLGGLGYRDDRYRWLREDPTPLWGHVLVALAALAPLVHIFVVMTRDDIAWLAAGVDLLAMLAAIGALLLMAPPPIITEKGARLQADLDGLTAYLSSTETDRLHTLRDAGDAAPVDVNDPSAVRQLDERLLPWAVLFAMQARWAAVLEQEYAAAGTTADWFDGDFSPAVLTAFTQAVSLSSLSGLYATGSIRGNLSGGGAAGGIAAG